MARFSLIGVDGNAFSIMGYTSRALKKAGLGDKVDEMHNEAQSGDYYNLIAVCDKYIDMANEALGLKDDDEDDDY